MNPAELSPQEPSGRFWIRFFVCLLGPAAVTWVAVAANWEPVSFGAMCASVVAPLVCAWTLAQRLRGTDNSMGLAFLGLTVALVPLSVGLCFGGCILGAKSLE